MVKFCAYNVLSDSRKRKIGTSEEIAAASNGALAISHR